MCALPPEEAERQSSLCAAAIAQVESQRNPALADGGQEALEDYAAAMAARRFVLRCLSTGGVVAIGDPRPGGAGALAAAEALERDYRRTASRWLRPRDFCFCQVPQPEETEEENPAENPGETDVPVAPENPEEVTG